MPNQQFFREINALLKLIDFVGKYNLILRENDALAQGWQIDEFLSWNWGNLTVKWRKIRSAGGIEFWHYFSP